MRRYKTLTDQKLGLDGIKQTFEIVTAETIEEAERSGIVVIMYSGA